MCGTLTVPVAEQEKGPRRVAAREGQESAPAPPEASGSRDRGSLVWHFPTSGVVIWSPVRKASEYKRFLASVPSLGHLIAETVSSLARVRLWPRA